MARVTHPADEVIRIHVVGAAFWHLLCCFGAAALCFVTRRAPATMAVSLLRWLLWRVFGALSFGGFYGTAAGLFVASLPLLFVHWAVVEAKELKPPATAAAAAGSAAAGHGVLQWLWHAVTSSSTLSAVVLRDGTVQRGAMAVLLHVAAALCCAACCAIIDFFHYQVPHVRTVAGFGAVVGVVHSTRYLLRREDVLRYPVGQRHWLLRFHSGLPYAVERGMWDMWWACVSMCGGSFVAAAMRAAASMIVALITRRSTAAAVSAALTQLPQRRAMLHALSSHSSAWLQCFLCGAVTAVVLHCGVTLLHAALTRRVRVERCSDKATPQQLVLAAIATPPQSSEVAAVAMMCEAVSSAEATSRGGMWLRDAVFEDSSGMSVWLPLLSACFKRLQRAVAPAVDVLALPNNTTNMSGMERAAPATKAAVVVARQLQMTHDQPIVAAVATIRSELVEAKMSLQILTALGIAARYEDRYGIMQGMAAGQGANLADVVAMVLSTWLAMQHLLQHMATLLRGKSMHASWLPGGTGVPTVNGAPAPGFGSQVVKHAVYALCDAARLSAHALVSEYGHDTIAILQSAAPSSVLYGSFKELAAAVNNILLVQQ